MNTKTKEAIEGLMVMDGFDDCILGVCERFGFGPVVAYDYDKIIKKLIKKEGMTLEEAEEYYSFNQLGAWIGTLSPVFVKVTNK